MSGIEGKVVAITGASSGIGEATALLLARTGRTSSSARAERIALRLLLTELRSGWRGSLRAHRRKAAGRLI